MTDGLVMVWDGGGGEGADGSVARVLLWTSAFYAPFPPSVFSLFPGGSGH